MKQKHESFMNNEKIIFDISEMLTYLSMYRRYSGIQRVVAMILKEFQNNENQQVWICFAKVAGGREKEYFALNIKKSDFQNWESPDLTYDYFVELGILGPGALILKYKNNKFKYVIHRTRFDLAAHFKKDQRFNKRGVNISEWKQYRKLEKTDINFVKLLDVINSNDKLVLLDSTWRLENIKMYKQVKLIGVNIFTMVYDLIPIISPNMVHKDLTKNFYKWLYQSADYTDFYISDSESAKGDLVKFLNDHKIEKSVTTLPLVQIGFSIPQKIVQEEKDPIPSDLELLSSLSDLSKTVLSSEYILCVGTIELRKNLWRLILAWKHLLDQGYCDLPRLVIVGRSGWNSENIWSVLNTTANLYGYVTILNNATDDELDLLYKNCLFVAMVSLYEGWGLPVGEALSYGKTAVVSNATSLPEVGMDLVEYCDPLSIDSIAKSITKLVYQPEYRQSLEMKIKNTKLRNWADVANDLRTLLQSKN